MTIWITSGDRPSSGRLALQKTGLCRKLRDTNQIKQTDWLINWGCGALAFDLNNNHMLNRPVNVRTASNKLLSFGLFAENDVSCVPFTADKHEAINWSAEKTVVARTKLTGHSGEGIVIVEPGETAPDAPLYTRYVFKTHEYRVHVVREKIIDVQRKIRDPDREPTNWKVRSHENGFIYIRGNVEVSSDIKSLCIQAVTAIGLDFGAVDVVVDKNGVAYVLEINTAPGLEGQTVESYSGAFREICT